MGSSGRKRDSLAHRLAVLPSRGPWPSELPSSFDAASQLQDKDSTRIVSIKVIYLEQDEEANLSRCT